MSEDRRRVHPPIGGISGDQPRATPQDDADGGRWMTMPEPPVERDIKSKFRIQSVSRAVQILLAIAEAEQGLQARQLADRLDLSLPTTYHLLSTLAAEGMLTKGADRNFHLGPRSVVIADAYARLDLAPPTYQQALDALASSTGETTYLSVWRQGGVKILATAEGAHAVRVVGLTAGYSENLHARASGKVLLAYASPTVRERIIATMAFPRLTAHTITDPSDFARELDQVRSSGIAFDHEEFRDGVTCVSTPILESGHVVACITISSPTARFDAHREAIVDQLTSTTSRLSDAGAMG